MFDSKAALLAFREKLRRDGNFAPVDIDELESHLQDHLEALEEVGIVGEDAFLTAEKRLGEVSDLGAEFAKVNAELAWQPPLFFAAMGCLASLLGSQAFFLIVNAMIAFGVLVGLSATTLQVGMWGFTLGGPVVFFGALYAWARTPHEKRTSLLLSKPWARVSLLVFGGAFALAMQLAYIPLNELSAPTWSRPESTAAWSAFMEANLVIGLAIPLVLAALTLRYRALARRSEKSATIATRVAWLMVGCFVSILSQELSAVVRDTSLLAGTASGLSTNGLVYLTWIVTICGPSAFLGFAHVWIHHRAPTPERAMHSRIFTITLLAACVACFVGWQWSGHFSDYVRHSVDHDARMATLISWVLARIVAVAVAPVTIGAVVLRARAAAQSRELA